MNMHDEDVVADKIAAWVESMKDWGNHVLVDGIRRGEWRKQAPRVHPDDDGRAAAGVER